MKKFSFTKKVSLLLAAIAVCVMASCFSMPVQAAAGPLTLSTVASEKYSTENYVYLESASYLGDTITTDNLKYSLTDATVTTGSSVSAALIGTSNGKYVYLVNQRFSPAQTIYIKYQNTDVLVAVTAPNAITSLTQTGATKNSVTVSWPASAGASGYYVYVGTSAANVTVKGTTSATSYTVGGLSADTGYVVGIAPYKTNGKGFNQYWSPKGKAVYSAPGKITGVSVYGNNEKTKQYAVKWSEKGAYNATGFEIMVVNKKGKKITSAIETQYVSTTFSHSKMRTQPWKVKVRAYRTLDNGSKAYGEWSATKQVVPNAYIKSISLTSRYSTNVKIKWSKVSGAKSYTVYYRNKATGKFKKLATVKGTSYTIKNAKKYKNYYIMVKANKVKIGKKSYSSTSIKNTTYNGFVIRSYY
ncbi:MAG: fibronectin type III domain-containing protein [Lachnospiraceae bacterium]|nr:fibronectin type III domain-containing protein [Lachnospiraceae bacterium]